MVKNIKILMLPLTATILMLAAHVSAENALDTNTIQDTQGLNMADGASDGYYVSDYGYSYCSLYPELCGYYSDYGYDDGYYGGGYYGGGWGWGRGGWGRGGWGRGGWGRGGWGRGGWDRGGWGRGGRGGWDRGGWGRGGRGGRR